MAKEITEQERLAYLKAFADAKAEHDKERTANPIHETYYHPQPRFLPNGGDCPCCGRCPRCGRGGFYTMPPTFWMNSAAGIYE